MYLFLSTLSADQETGGARGGICGGLASEKVPYLVFVVIRYDSLALHVVFN